MSSRIINQGFTDKDIFKKIRDSLVPRGTSDLVCLDLGTAAFFKHQTIKDAIQELERAIMMAQALDKPLSASHRLVLDLFIASAHITIPEDVQKEVKNQLTERNLRDLAGNTNNSPKTKL